MTEKIDRKITGTLKAYAKKGEPQPKNSPMTGEDYFEIGFLVSTDAGENWHNIRAPHKEHLEEFVKENPTGSKVEFEEFSTTEGKYWNHKPGSWKLIEKGSGYKGGGFKKFSTSYGNTKEGFTQDKFQILINSTWKTIFESVDKIDKNLDVKTVLKAQVENQIAVMKELKTEFMALHGETVKSEKPVDLDAIPEENASN